MKPPFQNYIEVQKRRLKAFADIKVRVADKNARLADLPGTADDPNYKKIAHLFGILDNLEVPERKKLRDVLS
jgi:hypothetical protein